MRETLMTFDLGEIFHEVRWKQLMEKYRDLELSEVVALERIGLVFTEGLKESCDVVSDPTKKQYILIDPLLQRDEQRTCFFKALALLQMKREAYNESREQ